MRLRDLLQSVSPVSDTATCAAVIDRFGADPELISIPVLRGERPVGLLNRHEILTRMSQQYGFALYGRKPVSTLMDVDPLVVDVDDSIDGLNLSVVRDKPSALLKGFIVVERARYLGIGSGLALLQITNAEMTARSRALEVARRDLERANLAKSQFLANMSHELRTPLNAIIGFSEVIQNGVFGPVGDPRYVEYIHDIHASGLHLLAVINDVLDMARFEAGRLDLHEDWLDLADLADGSLRIVQNRAERDGVRLVQAVPERLPALRGDATKLRQVLVNLLSNAVKFTPGGGSVKLAADVDGGELVLAVADTGIGIPADKLTEVMQPFRQADAGFDRKHEGAGLGLPLSKALVELHGGSLTLSSTLGAGTTVTIRLPAARLAMDAA
jgi:two-component system cell cycle sensor histidine kinase PleC